MIIDTVIKKSILGFFSQQAWDFWHAKKTLGTVAYSPLPAGITRNLFLILAQNVASPQLFELSIWIS